MKKCCIKCHIEKPLCEFNNNRHYKDGLSLYCREVGIDTVDTAIAYGKIGMKGQTNG